MAQRFAIFLINSYQACGRLVLPLSCRFSPSCSDYAKQAITKYGLLKGGLMAVSRLLSCHPFSGKAGYHPVI